MYGLPTGARPGAESEFGVGSDVVGVGSGAAVAGLGVFVVDCVFIVTGAGLAAGPGVRTVSPADWPMTPTFMPFEILTPGPSSACMPGGVNGSDEGFKTRPAIAKVK